MLNRLLVLILVAACGQALGATQSLFLNDSGVARIVVEHDPALSPAGAITIEAWVRPSDVSGFQTIVGKGFASAWWFGLNGGFLRSYTDGSSSVDDSNNPIDANVWTHVATTFDGTDRRFYINGELDRSANKPGGIGVNAQAMGIGGEGQSASFPSGLFPFEGRISEVRIWDHARSEAEIREAMFQQITQAQPGLVGVWALEGGPEDRFGSFRSVMAEGASWSSLDSPPVPHDPLVVRFTTPVTADGTCNDAGYSAAVEVPA